MSEQIHVRPANPAARIIDPANGDLLPQDGTVKDRAPYWLTLEARGDVIITAPATPAIVDKPKLRKEG